MTKIINTPGGKLPESAFDGDAPAPGSSDIKYTDADKAKFNSISARVATQVAQSGVKRS